jgi:hypothetical protein
MTIRIEDRGIYFEALEAAQVRDDPIPFARFIMNYVERSAQPRRTRRI